MHQSLIIIEDNLHILGSILAPTTLRIRLAVTNNRQHLFRKGLFRSALLLYR